MISGSQVYFHKSSLIFAENAAMYETNEEARSESPITQRMFLERYLTFSFQRLFSPASPLTSFSAAVSLARHALALASTSSFWIIA